MIRLEIISNQSVKDEIIDKLEESVPYFCYTMVDPVIGKGRDTAKLGTTTWPEMNFLLIAYLEDDYEVITKNALLSIKEKFPTEGIKYFMIHDNN